MGGTSCLKAQLFFASLIAERGSILATSEAETAAWRKEIIELNLNERFKVIKFADFEVESLVGIKSAIICADDRLTGLADRLGIPFFLLPKFSELSNLEFSYLSKPKKIAIIGPESTGKTTLARQLAEHFDSLWVPEYSRLLLEFRKTPCIEADVEIILIGQYALQKTFECFSKSHLICDTEPRLSKVWALFLYGRFNSKLDDFINASYFDHYAITKPDIPWEPDPLRSLPTGGVDFFIACISQFSSTPTPVSEIEGKEQARLNNAIDALEHLWN